MQERLEERATEDEPQLTIDPLMSGFVDSDSDEDEVEEEG